MVNIKREDFAKTVFRVNRFAESGMGQTYQIEAVHLVPLLQIIFEKEKIGQRRRKVVHLNLGCQLPKSRSCAKCWGARHHGGTIDGIGSGTT
jgi:hypothetical protein